MKFTDPLASLQYMGGAIPIHFSLCIYASYVYFVAYRKTDCDPVKLVYEKDQLVLDDKGDLILDTYDDIFTMFVIHLVCFVVFIVRDQITKEHLDRNPSLNYFKTLIKVISTTIYMYGFLKIQYALYEDL